MAVTLFGGKSFGIKRQVLENTVFSFLNSAGRTTDSQNPNAISAYNTGVAGRRVATLHFPSVQAFLRAAQAATFGDVNGFGETTVSGKKIYAAEFVERGNYTYNGTRPNQQWQDAPVTTVVYQNDAQVIYAGVWRKIGNDVVVERYEFDTDCSPHKDGAAFIYALMPMLMKDKEFSETFEVFCRKYREFVVGPSSPNTEAEITTALFRLCDNFYYRSKLNEFTAFNSALSSGNINLLSKTEIKKMPKFSPCEGCFEFFSYENKKQRKDVARAIPVSKLKGAYRLNDRPLTPEEEARVPEMPASYVIPKELAMVCKHIVDENHILETPIRNILLSGVAGTGKTEFATAVASALYRPKLSRLFRLIPKFLIS